MKKEILLVLLNQFADWEGAFIAPCLNLGIKPGQPITYTIKTLAKSKEPVTSLGGIRVLPDYDMQSVPEDHAGLILIGGMAWFSPEADFVAPLVEKATRDNKLVAGICNASVFLGMHGHLNKVKHTSNPIQYLKQYGKEKYRGEANYISQPAVRDGNIVTANGTGYLEFCREILYALNADTPEVIEEGYRFYKENGLG